MPLADLGKTARSLGLVSKYCRRVTKPFEFRALVIRDSKQLKATLGKIETEQVERKGEATIDVRHLFVCGVEPNIDLHVGNFSDEPMDDEELAVWLKNEHEYEVCAGDFQKYAAALVRNVHTTLVTLSISPRFRRASSDFDDLCIISGLFFPRLENLILKHSKRITGPGFVHPTAPLLRRIHLIAPRIYNNMDAWDDEDRDLCLHPLLTNMHSHFEALTHLVLCGEGIESPDDLLAVLWGSKFDAMKFKSTRPTNRGLPGRLVHVVLTPQYSYVYKQDYEQEYEQDYEQASSFCKSARALGIVGLEVHDPPPKAHWLYIGDILEEFEGLSRERW